MLQRLVLRRNDIIVTCFSSLQGVHCQERHLFLFDDLLLVAKAKSGSNFKLKDKVRISEIWLNESPAVIDEVAEIPKSSDTSFVIGWPTTNYVAVFRLVTHIHKKDARTISSPLKLRSGDFIDVFEKLKIYRIDFF